MDSVTRFLNALGPIAVLAALIFVAAYAIYGSRAFTKAFWLPSGGIATFFSALGAAAITAIRWAFTTALVLGALYLIVGVLHAMWRTT
jgi:hypothetical protein